MADPQARAVIWVGLADQLAHTLVDPRLLVDLAEVALPHERNDSIFSRAGLHLTGVVIRAYLPESEQAEARARMAAVGERVLAEAEGGSSRALHAARLIARTTDDVEGRLRPWADGIDLPEGLAGDADFRWIVLGQLARRGVIERADIEQARAADQTMTGNLGALTATAALPSAEDKAAAWTDLTTNSARSNYELVAIASGFWGPEDRSLVKPYIERYFTDVPAMASWLGEDALSRVASVAYPSRFATEDTLALSEACLAGDLDHGVRRAIVDAQSALTEALRSRQRYSGGE